MAATSEVLLDSRCGRYHTPFPRDFSKDLTPVPSFSESREGHHERHRYPPLTLAQLGGFVLAGSHHSYRAARTAWSPRGGLARRDVMARNAQRPAILFTLLYLFALPCIAHAQSAIGGVVRDTSGAVLPGVTVEASSDVLIERSRSVVTDDQGQYRVIDLRPGVY